MQLYLLSKEYCTIYGYFIFKQQCCSLDPRSLMIYTIYIYIVINIYYLINLYNFNY